MKILHKAAEHKWWAGRTIKCKCGFEATLEGDEDMSLQPFTYYGSFFDYSCDCGRSTEINSRD